MSTTDWMLCLPFFLVGWTAGALMGEQTRKWLFTPKPRHCWKEVRRETLGEFVHWGNSPLEITHRYRIAVHEECLLTGQKRIRETTDLFPAKEEAK